MASQTQHGTWNQNPWMASPNTFKSIFPRLDIVKHVCCSTHDILLVCFGNGCLQLQTAVLHDRNNVCSLLHGFYNFNRNSPQWDGFKHLYSGCQCSTLFDEFEFVYNPMYTLKRNNGLHFILLMTLSPDTFVAGCVYLQWGKALKR